jgi:hypothetical protein
MFQYIAAGLGVVSLLLGAVSLQQRSTIRDLRAETAVLESRVGDKDALIDRLNAATTALAAAAQRERDAANVAGSRLDTLRQQLSAERAARAADKEKDHALPACQALLETDLASVCPGHARSLRNAAGRVSRPRSEGPDSYAGATGPATDGGLSPGD